MQSPTQKPPPSGRLARWAAGLRFPRLLLLTGGIFLLDLVVPDMIPFVDEIMLGLLSLVLASIRTRRTRGLPTRDAAHRESPPSGT